MQRSNSPIEAGESSSAAYGISPSERMRAIDETLQAILASQYFRKSKRYPDLLRYVVDHTLKGDETALKERIVGAEVFGRPIDYDTNSDPCVRVAAGEVRRRVALYYSEHLDAPVKIELLLGSYSVQFHFRDLQKKSDQQEEVADTVEVFTEQVSPEDGRQTSVPTSTRLKSWMAVRNRAALITATLLIGVACAASVFYFEYYRARHSFWAPMMQEAQVSPLIVVAYSPSTTAITRPLDGATENNIQPSMHGTLDINIAAAKICTVFGKFNRNCEIIPAHTATLQDFRNRSIVLVGNLDSTWTMRLMAPLRYRLVNTDQPADGRGDDARIVDTYQTGNSISWQADGDNSSNGIRHDYAVISRFHSNTTGSSIVIFAGLDNLSTHTVASLAAIPGKLGQIIKMAPSAWSGDNLEAVVQIDVLKGYPESSKVVATYFW